MKDTTTAGAKCMSDSSSSHHTAAQQSCKKVVTWKDESLKKEDECLVELLKGCLHRIEDQHNAKKKNKVFKAIGNAILLASIQASIGSVEMSSKFSVINFSKDQGTLQAAADALTGYMIIAVVWTFGAIMISLGQFGVLGFFCSLISNVVMIGWIIGSYIVSFRIAAKRYNLRFPKLFLLQSEKKAEENPQE